ncbi:hypothetical protein EZV62_007664 [Acer yangbiense]|uniref:Co-chaperone protein p23 n=1 Tax=Acer yangbiense TaxID=1000413 RepID=A0A5C7IC36_9ROSI|nr:hypothetical protein EZV62_007664 [Acer yangbiense]
MSRHPEVLWAQRSDRVYLTVALPDAKDISVKSDPEGSFSFSATGLHGEIFHFNLEFYGKIVPEESKSNSESLVLRMDVWMLKCRTKAGLRNIICSIQKEEKGWWKRLLKSEEKPAPYIKVDWNKWCDEDDEESNYLVYNGVLSLPGSVYSAAVLNSGFYLWSNCLAFAVDLLSPLTQRGISADLASDDDEDVHVGEDDEGSDDEGMLYLPDLEKARGI